MTGSSSDPPSTRQYNILHANSIWQRGDRTGDRLTARGFALGLARFRGVYPGGRLTVRSTGVGLVLRGVVALVGGMAFPTNPVFLVRLTPL